MTLIRSTDKPVIAVAGSAGLDVTLRDAPRDWIGEVGSDVYTPVTLRPLEAPPEMGLGGNGAAAGYVIGKLGLDVRLNAPISTDATGQLIRAWLDEAGVQCVAPLGRSSMVSITAVGADSKRLGTLQHAGPTVDWALSAQDDAANWLLLAMYAQVTDEDLPQVRDALSQFRAHGGVTVLDTGVGWMQRLPAKQITELWSQVDLLLGTVEELGHWTGASDPGAIAASALALGPDVVVVKMGADGAAWQSRACAFEHQRACPVSCSDVSIGAGDAFNGALVAALASGTALPTAVTQAQQIAAKVVDAGRGVLGWQQSAKL
jgi:sugar/nucleoside kinase (ribokinase family)